jgi:SAM-dependent methyltransferase
MNAACDMTDAQLCAHNELRWEVIADKYESSFPLSELRLAESVGRNHRILDYGCGEGRCLEELIAAGVVRPYGCDVSPRMCERARKRNPSAGPIVTCELQIAPFREGTFDAVIMTGVLSSVIGIKQRRNLIGRLVSLLRKDGLLFIGDCGCSPQEHYKERYSRPVLEAYTFCTSDGIFIHHFAQSELAALVQDVSTILEVKTIIAHTSHGNRVPGHIVVSRRY